MDLELVTVQSYGDHWVSGCSFPGSEGSVKVERGDTIDSHLGNKSVNQGLGCNGCLIAVIDGPSVHRNK